MFDCTKYRIIPISTAYNRHFFSYLCAMKTIKLDTQETKKLVVDYKDENVMLLDNIHQVESVREAIRTEFFLLMMVEQGQSNAVINKEEVFLEQGDMLICTPGNIIESGMVSINFHSLIFLATPAHAYNLLKDTHVGTLRYLAKDSYISMHLSPQGQNIFLNFYNLISSYGTFHDEELRRQCVQKALQAFSCAVVAFLIEHGRLQQQPVRFSAAESLFRSFARLLREHPNGRSVQFYAEKLNISPKYFNTICKQVAGKTASTLINEELVNQAKIMLKDPDLSIKQIASTLGFSNQSHFGTFIRRETGVSPQALRKNHAQD